MTLLVAPHKPNSLSPNLIHTVFLSMLTILNIKYVFVSIDFMPLTQQFVKNFFSIPTVKNKWQTETDIS